MIMQGKGAQQIVSYTLELVKKKCSELNDWTTLSTIMRYVTNISQVRFDKNWLYRSGSLSSSQHCHRSRSNPFQRDAINENLTRCRTTESCTSTGLQGLPPQHSNSFRFRRKVAQKNSIVAVHPALPSALSGTFLGSQTIENLAVTSAREGVLSADELFELSV